jgi:hypothetical protein
MTWQPDLWSYDGLPAVANVAEASQPMTSPNGTRFRVVREGLELRAVKDTHTKPTQAGRILAHLRAGNRLTALEALERFQCFRLAARIHELRREGWQIEERTVETPSGKRVAEYWI